MKARTMRLLASILHGALVCLAYSGLAGTALAQAPPQPWKYCPPVGSSPSCGVLIVINADTSVSVYTANNPSVPPYDGGAIPPDDTLVGVLNNSSNVITSLPLNGNILPIFGFEGDGICDTTSGSVPPPHPAGCPFGPTGYEGQISSNGVLLNGVSFAPTSPTTGTVNFKPGLGKGDYAYFGLEEPLTASSVTVPPTITSLSPASAVVGSPAFNLTVNGTNFVSGAAVTWTLPGQPATTLITIATTTTQIIVAVPASLVAAIASAAVAVLSPSGTSSNSVNFAITAKPPTITTTSLPAGVVNSVYSTTLSATGGQTPYTWTASGLPGGLSVNSSTGVIAGTPSVAGTFPVSITVADNSVPKLTGTANLSLVISPGLTLSTMSLPAGTTNSPYSATMSATGGTPPYNWSGTGLPAGLSLNSSTGVISGTPSATGTFNVSVTVSDTSSPRQTVTKSMPLSVVAGPPPVKITGNATVNPTQTNPFSITLPSAAQTPSSGTLSLQFASDAVNPVNSDPEVTFVSGTTPVTSVGFSFSPGQTQATLSPPNAAVQAGTVAGTITIVGNYPGTPSSPIGTMTVPRTAPQITGVKLANKTASGFDVCVTGYSSRRDITAVTYQFISSGQGSLQTTSLTAGSDLVSKFTAWFQSSPSAQFGGQFLLDQIFTISGPDTAIGMISVTLQNDAGTMTSVNVPYSGFAASCN